MQEQNNFLVDIIAGLKNYSNMEIELEKLFHRMNSKKDLLGYQGFEQFIKFGERARKNMSPETHDLILNSINAASFSAKIDDDQELQPLVLQLECDQKIVNSVAISDIMIIQGLMPGNYTLKTNSDWLLWQGDLSQSDLLWTCAFPEQDLPLAADTDEADEVLPGKEIELLDGELKLSIYPGLESGVMKIKVVG